MPAWGRRRSGSELAPIVFRSFSCSGSAISGKLGVGTERTRVATGSLKQRSAATADTHWLKGGQTAKAGWCSCLACRASVDGDAVTRDAPATGSGGLYDTQT